MLLPLLLLPGLLLAQQSGLAIVGGDHPAYTSAEFWAPAPGELHCSLPSLTRKMSGHTLDTWQDTLVACSGNSCDQLTPSGWQHWRNTSSYRVGHTSAVTSQGLLLVGGADSPTNTELLPWMGGESRESFTLQEERVGQCSIQTRPDTIVLTGGYSSSLVTEYSDLDAGEEVTSRELPPLLHSRYDHACGWYSVGDSQVLMVTGGRDSSVTFQSTTELFPLTGPGAGSWREAGLLPSPRDGLRAAKVGELLHLTGGIDGSGYVEEILTWDSVLESWIQVGHMETDRYNHGVTEVSLAVVADYCSAN